MPAPAVASAGAALRNPRVTRRVVAIVVAIVGLWRFVLVAVLGPLDARGFARADHCDHVHWGMDA